MYTTFSKTSVLIREHKPSEHSSETDCRQSSIPECRDYTLISTKLFKKKDKEKKLKNTSEPHKTSHKGTQVLFSSANS
jgi:hypothetical protein